MSSKKSLELIELLSSIKDLVLFRFPPVVAIDKDEMILTVCLGKILNR